MSTYYLAIDIGASGGRHILGSVENGKMKMEEIYRFENGLVDVEGQHCWDVDRLFAEILEGMKECGRQGKIPASVGIDTWAVDYVLLDEENNRIGKSVAYRDERTEGADKMVYDIIPEQELYGRNGIQKLIFNTVYQLMAHKRDHSEELEQADSLLMIPDYFHYLLSGVKGTEYTNATTAQLIDPDTKDWDWELIRILGYPEHVFQKILQPGTVLGNLLPEIREQVGYDCQVVIPATHDTASAVLAVPADTGWDHLYISSGTWSLMGVERPEADCSEISYQYNFTNEGGYDYRYRYLKNIMGMWMIQSVRREQEVKPSYDEICRLAEETQIESIVDCTDPCFLAPKSMQKAIADWCKKSGQRVPQNLGEYAEVIYRSLAVTYRKTAEDISKITGISYPRIYIVGGGSQADYLNRLTAREMGCTVMAGPTEATAIGNLAVQMLSQGVWADLAEARACIRESFDVKEYPA